MVMSFVSGFSTSRATGFPTGGRDTHVLERPYGDPSD
jgi:hypothetical protein